LNEFLVERAEQIPLENQTVEEVVVHGLEHFVKADEGVEI
jgi:hypothetical protein